MQNARPSVLGLFGIYEIMYFFFLFAVPLYRWIVCFHCIVLLHCTVLVKLHRCTEGPQVPTLGPT